MLRRPALLMYSSPLSWMTKSEASGVAASATGDPLARLFALRAGHVLGMPTDDAPGFASGLLIGAEVRAGLGSLGGEPPVLIGRPDLCALYAAAIAEVRGEPPGSTPVIDGNAAFRAGIGALAKELA